MIRKVGYRVYPYDKTSCRPAGGAAGRRTTRSVNVGWCSSAQTIRIRCDGQLAACICCRDMRNKIAHGDFAASKTPGEVKDMASMIQAFCRSTDAVFATWWGKSFCAVR